MYESASALSEDSIITSRKPKPGIKLKAYGITLHSKQEQQTECQTITESKRCQLALSQKAKIRDSQKTSSDKIVLWISVCCILFLLICIAYRISRR